MQALLSATEPVKVPVTATQKDDWWWAFLILLPGLGISFCLFTYASDFKKKDEIQSALSVIDNCVNKDSELTTTTYQMSGNTGAEKVHNPFSVRIFADIPQAQSKLNLDAISEAEKCLNDVKDSWDNWNTNRALLRTKFDRCEKLVARMNILESRILSDAPGNSNEVMLIKTLREDLQDKFSAVCLKDTGQELAKSIISYEKICNSLLRVVERLEYLESLCATKETNSCPLCKTLPDVWNNLVLTDDPQKPDTLLKDVETWIETVSKCDDKKTKGAAAGMVRAPELALLEGGELPAAEIPRKGKVAALHLNLFKYGTYAAAIILLVIYGMFQFYVANGRLSCQMYQRSADIFLGVPFNIASYAQLTMMVAQVTGLKPGEFVHTLGDAHLYLNHIEQTKLQLTRTPYALPQMNINNEVKNIFDFKYEDFKLENYNSHPHIKADISV